MSEGGEKTEMPTPKKLRDAREKGQVNNSKDITSTALLLVLMCIIGILTPMLMRDLKELFIYLSRLFSVEGEAAINEGVKSTVIIIVKYSFIVCVAAAVTGVAAQLAQIGFLFTFEPIKPDLNKVNPVQGAKKIFSKKNLFELFKNTLKITFLGYLIYKLVMESIPVLLTLCYGDLEDSILPVLGKMLKNLAIYTGFGYIVIAFADFFFQKKNFMKEMMMTKDEVKREYKEMEGSQEVKQAQSQFRNEILNEPPSRQAVGDSSVVVTNPTHLAVGVRYMAGETPLPKVVVKGAGTDAERIKSFAAELDIPVMENVQLARALYSQVKVDDYVPEELFAPLVELLKMIKDIKQTRQEEEELSGVKLDDDLDNLDDLDDLNDLEAPDDTEASKEITVGNGKIDLDG